jgi:hypothetical protein
METTTSGRVLPIRGGDMLSPAFCGICRKPGTDVDETFADPNELFADPQIMEEFFGSLYFCRACSLSLAAIFGAKSNEEIAEIVKQRDDLLVDNAVKSATIQELQDAIGALTRVYDRSNPGTNIPRSVASFTGVTTEPSPQQRLSEPTEQRTDESPEPTESSNGEGPDDTNEPASDDVDAFLRNL